MPSFGYTPLSASTAAVTNRIVTTTNMIVGAYAIANASPAWQGGALITITHTTVVIGTDTLGTITLVGKDLSGQTITEVIIPLTDSTATSTQVFRSVASATGAGWIIAGGNDTLVIGVAAGSYVASSGGTLRAVVVNTTAAATVVLSDKKGTIATLKASIAEGTYYYDLDFSGFLRVATTSTNDLTIIHSPTLPSNYALA